MKELYHYLLGAVWIIACILLGIYIRGRGWSEKRHYSSGLKAIFLSYLVGVCLLFAAIVMS